MAIASIERWVNIYGRVPAPHGAFLQSLPITTVYAVSATPTLLRYFDKKYAAEVLPNVPIFFPFKSASTLIPESLFATMR